MFSKTLFSIVLFCAVIFANGESESKVQSRDRSVAIQNLGNVVQAFLEDQSVKVDKFVKDVRDSFEFWINRISGNEHATEKKKIAALEKKLVQTEAEWTKKLDNNSATWQQRLAELQKDLEAAKEADAETFAAKVQALNEALLQSNRDYEDLRSSYSKIIQGVREELDKANGESESKVQSRDRSVSIKNWGITVKAFFKRQAEKVDRLVHEVEEGVKFWVDRISGKEHARDEAKIAALKKKLDQTQAEWSKKINENTANWQVRIAQLQEELEAARDADAEEFNAKVQELNEALLQSHKEYESLKNKYSLIIEAVKNEIDKAPKNQ